MVLGQRIKLKMVNRPGQRQRIVTLKHVLVPFLGVLNAAGALFNILARQSKRQ
jgi:hypothetical protein